MPKKKSNEVTLLHICDYAASYRGNFIDSITSLETYHQDVKNLYLFPYRARKQIAKEWIEELNAGETVAYIQEKNLLKNIILLVKIIRRHKIDVILRHFSDLRIDLALKLVFSSKKVIRFFHTAYGQSSASLMHSFRRFLWKKNKLVGVSDAIADDIRTLFPGFQVFSIINAIRFERLDVVDPFPKSEKLSFLMMGRDIEIKGVDLALAALNRLHDKYDFAFRILSLSKEEEVKQFVVKMFGKAVDWITFLPPTNNIGTYYAASDIFLSPSRKEAFGYANIEAAYCGNSVVLSRVSGQGEIKLEGAYWCESENVEDLTSKIEMAIIERNKPEKIAQREQVKQQVQEIYSLENWCKQVMELVKETIA